jgi:hypothetical protein
MLETPGGVDIQYRNLRKKSFVIPAKAGIHHLSDSILSDGA